MLSTAETWGTFQPPDPQGDQDFLLALELACRGMYPEDVARFRDSRREDYSKYQDAPAAYIREVLKGEPTPKQEEIADLLMKPPYKVIAVSCNNYGKSHLAGGLINWWYDSFDPSICITTAPRQRDVEAVLWSEVRNQRRTRWDFVGDRAPELKDGPNHYAVGYTGTKVDAFHGRHAKHMLFVLDEATALKQFVWTGIKSMFKRTGNHHLLGLLNPTDTTSPAYAECESGKYHIVTLSALEHPNVLAQLRGADDPPIENAVDCDQVIDWLTDPTWFEPIRMDQFQLGDVVWPPLWTDGLGTVNGVDLAKRAIEKYGVDHRRQCFRPGPEGQARVLGEWPSATPGAIWSDVAWKCAVRSLPGMQQLPLIWERPPEVGCDVARGTSDRADKTEIVVQIGGCAIEHRYANGWDTTRTVAELIDVCDKFARVYNERRDPRKTNMLSPKAIPIKVDDGGLGGGVVDQLKALGYLVVPINASTASLLPQRYPLMRDQLWFAVPLAAREGTIDLSRLLKSSQVELRRQAMAVQWAPDIHGRRKVEKKEKTKERLQRSPDGMDALNLAFCAAPAIYAAAPQVTHGYQGPMPSANPPPAGPFGGNRNAR